METDCLMGMGFLLGVTETFWNWVEVVVAQLCEYTKRHCMAHVKMVNVTILSLKLKIIFFKIVYFRERARASKSTNGGEGIREREKTQGSIPGP